MKNRNSSYLDIKLKPNYFDEFICCGLPVPPYSNQAGFVLKFRTAEIYSNYVNVLKLILQDLQLADVGAEKYELQHSIIFIQNILNIMRQAFSSRSK